MKIESGRKRRGVGGLVEVGAGGAAQTVHFFLLDGHGM